MEPAAAPAGWRLSNPRRCDRSWEGGRSRIDLRRADLARLRSVVASYSGHLQHGRAMRDWETAWDRHPWLGALFAREGWAVEERWPLRRIAQARRFQGQYWELVRRAGEGCLLFCQIGRFVEFRGPQRAAAERFWGFGGPGFRAAPMRSGSDTPPDENKQYSHRFNVEAGFTSGAGSGKIRRWHPNGVSYPARFVLIR